MKTLSLNTVTPVYAGAEYLPQLVNKIEALRDRWAVSEIPLELTEAIFVNDASIDNSLEILYTLQESRPWIRIINLSRNFGQHQATIAGILHSSGDWVITLDEDLQHDPIFIDEMLQHTINQKRDITFANPDSSVHKNIIRDWGSSIYKNLVARITGNRHVKKFNSFRLIRGDIARGAASVCAHGTYLDVVLCWFTDKISAVSLPLVDQRFVESGNSGYTLRKLFSHARRLIISSEAKVLRFGALIGFIAIFIAIIFGLNIFYDKLFSPESIPVQGWTSLILTVLFFSGLITILVGIVLEYISVIVLHIQGKPTFFVVDRRSDKALRDYFDKNSK
ncbi:MAG: glycosyltransferase [Xanthomonadales bacterium]|nr:glycosyltransferase [Xanthomonadales bacterium]